MAFGGTLAVLQATAPDVYTFVLKGGGNGTAPGQLIYPLGAATGPQNRIYVADTNNNRIQVFNADGTYAFGFGILGSAAGQFNAPTGIAVDTQGLILVADNDNHRLQLFSATGTWLRTIGDLRGNYDVRDPFYDGSPPRLDRFNFPVRVALLPGTRLNDARDQAGRVAVLDQANNRVVVFDSDFNPKFAFGNAGTDGTAPGNFIDPWGLSMDLTNIYVADPQNHRIQVFDTAGNYISSFGNAPPGNQPNDLQNPFDVQLDGGHLIVADTDRSRILILNPDQTASPTPRCSELAVAKAGGRCTIVASNGIKYDARIVGQNGIADGEFAFPQAVAVDSLGRLVVADTNNHQFQVFQAARIAISNPTVSTTGPVQSGQPVDLDVTVTNTGATPLTISLTAVPSLQGTLNFRAGGAPTFPSIVAPGSTATFPFTFVTNETGTLTFRVSATGLTSTGSTVAAGPVTSGPVTVTAAPGPKMVTSISASPSVVGPGGIVTVQVTVKNTGNVPLLNLAPSVLVSPTNLGTLTPGVGWVQTPLAPGPGSQRAFDYTFTPAALAVGTVTFQAGANAAFTGLTKPPTNLGSLVADAASGPSTTVNIVSDATPPSTTSAVSGTLGSGGWYTSALHITLTATDNVAVKTINFVVGGLLGFSGSIPGTGATTIGTVDITFEGNAVLTYWAEDTAGNVEQPRTLNFKIDYTPPNIYIPVLGGVAPAPNQANWINRYPTVTFGANDGGSTVTFLTPPVLLSQDGAGQVIAGTARDYAGNTSTISVTLNVDTKPPTLVCAPTVAPTGLNGWFTKPGTVTISCIAIDQPGLSGMLSVRAICPTNTGTAPITPTITPAFTAGPLTANASCTISAEGVHTVIGEAKDAAGNLTAKTLTIKIDRTPPVLTCNASAGAIIWPRDDKMVAWNPVVTATDRVSSATFKLVAFFSNERDDDRDRGKGHHDKNMTGWTLNTSDTSGFVRAERDDDPGRIYTLKYLATDLAGNTATCSVSVMVPHETDKDGKDGKAKSGDGKDKGGSGKDGASNDKEKSDGKRKTDKEREK